MDLRKLKTLIDLVSESNVHELEITEAEGKIRIVKGGGSVVHTHLAPAAMALPAIKLSRPRAFRMSPKGMGVCMKALRSSVVKALFKKAFLKVSHLI